VRPVRSSGIVEGMRSTLRSVPLLLATACLPAQDAWAPVARAAAALRSPESYVLVAALPAPEFAWFGEDSLGAEYRKGLTPLSPSAEVAAVMARLPGAPDWALYAPSGLRIAEGKGLPAPGRVRALMEDDGWRSQWDGLRNHLRDHPGDSQAWQEAIQGMAVHAAYARQAGSLGPGLLGTLRQDLSAALKGFEASLGEGGEQLSPAAVFNLVVAGLHEDPETGPAVIRYLAQVRPLLARDPEDVRLWNMGINIPQGAEAEPGALAATLALPGVPGRPWPPPLAAFFLRLIHRDAPAVLAREAASILEANLDPALVRKLGRGHVNRMFVEWGGLRLEALLRQGRVEEALAEAANLRARSGSAWRPLSIRVRAVATATESRDGYPPLPVRTPAQTSQLLDALGLPPLPDPPLPESPSLRLAMLGPHGRIDWARVQIDGRFKVWDPGDVTWTPLTAAETRALREAHAWEPGPRWVLLQGDRLLATGPGLPSAATLDAALRDQATPRLDTLTAFIKANPDRLDARRERMDMLRPRLPDPALEALYLADAEATCGSLEPLPFKPDPLTWGPAARRICATLARRLRAWPANPYAWRAYAQWSALDGRIPPPQDLLEGLEPWPRMGGYGLAGPVPALTTFGVERTLAAAGRTRDLDGWMRVLWSRGLSAFLADWASLPARRGRVRSDFDTQALLVPDLLADWGKALRKTGDARRLAEVRFDLEAIREGLGALLGAGE